MDIFIISKISDYFSVSKCYDLAMEIKNKAVSKILLEKQEKYYKRTAYVCYPDTNGIRSISVPNMIEKTDYPELNYKEMTSKGIKNYMFFYNLKQKHIHAFRFFHFEYIVLDVDEELDETVFYEIDEISFWLNVNHTHMYQFEGNKRTKKINLTQGFFFEEVLIHNKLHSDFFGDEIVIQDLLTEEAYKLRLLNNTYYDIVAKDLIIIDFSFNENVLNRVLPNNDLKLEDKKNALFKFYLVKGNPNYITLEFVKWLPKEYSKIERICAKNGYFFLKNDSNKELSIFKREKEIVRHEVPQNEKIVSIQYFDSEKLLIEYNTEIIFVYIATGKMGKRIDMKQKIDRLKYLGTFEKVGDYYNINVLLDKEDLGCWAKYVLDQNFLPIYTITEEFFLMYSD